MISSRTIKCPRTNNEEELLSLHGDSF